MARRHFVRKSSIRTSLPVDVYIQHSSFLAQRLVLWPLRPLLVIGVEEHFYLIWLALVLLLTTKRLLWFCDCTLFAVATARFLADPSVSLDVAVDVLAIFRIEALVLGALLAALLQSLVLHNPIRRFAPIASVVVIATLVGIMMFGSKMFGLPALLVRIFFTTQWLLSF